MRLLSQRAPSAAAGWVTAEGRSVSGSREEDWLALGPQAPLFPGKSRSQTRPPELRMWPAAPPRPSRDRDLLAGPGRETGPGNGSRRAAPGWTGAESRAAPLAEEKEGRQAGAEPGGGGAAGPGALTCERLLESPAEHLQPLLAHAAPRSQEPREEAHGGGDLGEHVCPLPGPAVLAHVRGSGAAAGG